VLAESIVDVGRQWGGLGESHRGSSGVAGRILADERPGVGNGESDELAV
jgi:hypothetical protein